MKRFWISLALAILGCLFFVEPAEAADAVVVIAGVVLVGVGVVTNQPSLIGIGVSLLLGAVSRSLAEEPVIPDEPIDILKLTGRTRDFQEALTTRKIVYGEQRVSGPRTLIQSTTGSGGEENNFLHIVIPLAGHEVEAIDEVYLGDVPYLDEDLDSAGIINFGDYAGLVRIKKHLGTVDQAADSDLVAEITDWTTDHRGRRVAYIYLRFEFNRDAFHSSLPPISAMVKGKKVVETRDSAAPTQFTTNSALILRDYVITATKLMGMGFAAATEIDDDFTDSAANICDQEVTVANVTKGIEAVDIGNDLIDFADEILIFQLGDKVNVTSTGAVPSGLGLGLFAVPHRRIRINLDSAIEDKKVSIKFASTYSDALAGNIIDITDAGSGIISVTKVAEPRYTANGILDSKKAPNKNLEMLLLSMGGTTVHIGGTWKIMAAGFNTPTVSFDEGDMRGPLKVATKQPRKARFNAVKGFYVSPINNGVPTDFPSITNSTYETEDNGERIWHELQLLFVSRAHTAQRLAKIVLEAHRQQITLTLPLNLSGLQVQPRDVIQYSNTRMGWVDKEFEIVEWGLSTAGDDTGVPLLGVDLVLKETASGVYDWNSGEETTVDIAPNTNLPNPFSVAQPTGIGLSTDFHLTENGTRISRVKVSWTAPADFFVTNGGFVEIAFKRSADSGSFEPSFLVDGADIEAYVIPVEDGVPYDFRIRSVNYVNAVSDWVTITEYIIGSTAIGVEARWDYGFFSDLPVEFYDRASFTETADKFLDRGDFQ